MAQQADESHPKCGVGVTRSPGGGKDLNANFRRLNEVKVTSHTERRVVLVSGPPASGKTTIARPLAERLGFALLSKDDIKETLFTAMAGPAGDVEFSRRIGAAAMDLLWALATRCPRVVLEANFRTTSDYERTKVSALDAEIMEVYCRLPLEEASRRFAERARRERHHPAHALKEMPPNVWQSMPAPSASAL